MSQPPAPLPGDTPPPPPPLPPRPPITLSWGKQCWPMAEFFNALSLGLVQGPLGSTGCEFLSSSWAHPRDQLATRAVERRG